MEEKKKTGFISGILLMAQPSKPEKRWQISTNPRIPKFLTYGRLPNTVTG